MYKAPVFFEQVAYSMVDAGVAVLVVLSKADIKIAKALLDQD